MMRVFDSSSVFRNGQEEPLVRSASVVHDPGVEASRGRGWTDPALVLWTSMVAVLAFTFRGIVKSGVAGDSPSRRSGPRLLDAALFLCTGAIGCLISYLTFFSVHTAMKANLNLLWLLPTNVVAGLILLVRRTSPRALSWYFAAVATLCIVPLLAWPFWPQQMHPTMIPPMLTIGARASRLSLSLFRPRGSVPQGMAR